MSIYETHIAAVEVTVETGALVVVAVVGTPKDSFGATAVVAALVVPKVARK